ncbi:MAG: CsiV family protein [Methylococcaceae bacterium]
MKQILFKVFILGFFFINVQAAERSYKIEIIVFKQDDANTEVFEEIESNIEWPRKITNRSEFENVNTTDLSLKESYSKLAGDNNSYQPLLYEAWIQKAKANSYSRAVRISNAEGTIQGFFMLQRGHLIHMIADIEYSPEMYEEPIIYRLNEKRRFKLNETHYLDHPKFGVVVKVSPVDD